MRKFVLLLAAACAVIPLAITAGVSAHPEEGELYVPWAEELSGDQAMRGLLGQGNEFQSNAAPSPAGGQGMTLVGNSDKDGTTNSDLAFYGNLAFAGNYDGFRILDIRSSQPRVVVDYRVPRSAERRVGLQDSRPALSVPVDRHAADRRGLHERRQPVLDDATEQA